MKRLVQTTAMLAVLLAHGAGAASASLACAPTGCAASASPACAAAACAVALDADALSAAARAALLAAMDEAGGWSDVDLRALPLVAMQRPAGGLELRARPVDADRVRPLQRVWVDVWVDGRFVRSVAVRFEVRAHRSALRALRELQPGTAIDADSVVAVEVDPFGTRLLLEPASRVGPRVARRRVAANDLLARADAQAQGRVERGQPVGFVLRQGTLSVQDIGTALDSGAAGQPVRVMPRRSTQPLQGRLASSGIVMIEGGERP